MIPTKTTRRSGPSTSGTALRSFGFGFGVFRPRVDARLELAPQILAGDGQLVPRPARLELDEFHRRIPTAVAAGVALVLGERAQADDEPQRTSRSGRHVCDDGGVPVKPRELRFAVDLGVGGEFLDENGLRLDVPPEWTPEHLLLAALVRCSLASLRYHAGRAGITVGDASGSAQATVTKRDGDERYAVVEAEVALAVELQPEPDDLAGLLAKAERDCFVGASLTAKPSYRWTVNGRA